MIISNLNLCPAKTIASTEDKNISNENNDNMADKIVDYYPKTNEKK